MLLLNCKVELSLRWVDKCVLPTAAIGADANATGADSATFKITDAKRYVPVVNFINRRQCKITKTIKRRV